MAYAHSPNRNGEWQLAEDHGRNVGALAQRFCTPFGCGPLGRLLGETHDAGKCSRIWQKRLIEVHESNRSVGVDHKTLACEIIERLQLDHDLVLPLHGHHGGLTSHREVKAARRRVEPEELESAREALPAYAALFDDWRWAADLAIPWTEPLVREMGIRMLFSALCDADSLDTRAHERGLTEPEVRPDADFAELWERYQQRRLAWLADREPGRMDPLRRAVFDACVNAAEHPPGVFRLGTPTGSAKTLAVGAFGLRHAALHGKRRVIVALPWKTVTAQNAEEYRRLLDTDDEPVVLEHHSGYQASAKPDRSSGESCDDDPWESEAAENWDAPFIVTTTVRLFESLLGRTRTATSRLHRLVDSVIVIDEVQGLPIDLLQPILDALRIMVEHFGVTVVMCSATQPAFEALEPFRELAGRDIEVGEPELVKAANARVEFVRQRAEGRTLLDVADEAAEHGSVLMVLNTTNDAARVAEHWGRLHPGESVYHLSTRMSPAHRNAVIDEVKHRLDRELPTRLASTQLIEAGVDLDFPIGYRAPTGVDSAIQAGGRVNRSGRLDGPGRLVVFEAEDVRALRDQETAAQLAEELFWTADADPTDPELQTAYWIELYDLKDTDGSTPAGAYVQQWRTELDYRAVVAGPLLSNRTGARDHKKAFRMITSDPVAVIIPQAALEERYSTTKHPDGAPIGASAELIERLRTRGETVKALRELQPFIANLHPAVARRPDVQAYLEPVLGKCGDPGSVAVWKGQYSSLTGMKIDPELEDFVQ